MARTFSLEARLGFSSLLLALVASCGPAASPDAVETRQSAVITPVVVTVVDGAGVPQGDFDVAAIRNNGSIIATSATNASGQATFMLQDNAYRFGIQEQGIEFFSGAVGHCVTPGCTAATITITRVDVLVVDTGGAPRVERTVWWRTPGGVEDGYSDTGADGHVKVPTPAGSYQFVTNIDGFEFLSGASGHCTVPGCSAVTITVDTVTVTVRDTTGAPVPNMGVFWQTTTGAEGGWTDTDANGVAAIFVEHGAQRFIVEAGGAEFVSGPSGHCVVPSCTSATITVGAPVAVTVTDTGGAPIVGNQVFWVNATGGENFGFGVATNASGVAMVRHPLEPVRFRVTVDGTQFFSGAAVHCSQPGCTSATISVSQPTEVTVVNATTGAGMSGRQVTALLGSANNGTNKTTDLNGRVTYRLPFGNWRFRATCAANNEQFFSGSAGHCFIPGGCLAARITMPCGVCAGQTNGTPCEDANPCTVPGTTTCMNQRCNGGTPTSCTASDQCHVAGACIAETGACSNPPKANGVSCNDSNSCTQTDTCQAGACVGANPVVCTASDQCHDAGTCNPGTGVCSNPAKANGVACNDGNACTQTDSCQVGACVGANPITCTAQDQCHVAGTCNPATGVCSTSPPATNGTACNDGNRCSVSDSCQAGTCLPGPATGCGAGQAQYVAVIDLGSAQVASFATGINNSGVVVGAETPNGSIYQLGYPGTKGFRWSESGGKVYLPGTSSQSYAVDINDAGVMSVTAGVDPWVMLPCRYDPATDTQPVCQTWSGNAGGINAAGMLTGSSYYPDGAVSMFRLGTGAIEILPMAPGSDSRAKGVAIDGDGTVVGNQYEGEGILGVRYTGARGAEWLVDLMPAGSGWSSANPTSIRSGQILGWGMHDGHGRAFRMRTAANGDVTEVFPLPVPSTYPPDTNSITIAAEANASGEIVGSVYDGIPYWPLAAFVYTDATGSVDLNTLIDPQSGWQLTAGFAINDNHQIVGYGVHDGANHAFKLTLPNLSPCPPADSCHTQGPRDLLTGVCPQPATKPNGAPCDDGSACTIADACNAGVCQGSTTVACTAPDACHAAGTCNTNAASPQPPSTQDLLGWWRMDGNGDDASGGGHPLTNEGATPAPGRVGQGMKFDGTACMTAPIWDAARMQGASGLTVMAWVSPSQEIVCPTAPSQGMTVAGRGWDYSIGSKCDYATPDVSVVPGLRLAGVQNWGYGSGWGGVYPNDWVHTAFTWEGGVWRFYYNGQPVLSGPAQGNLGDIEPTFAVGCMVAWLFTENQRIQHFKGTIDEVMLYRRALTAAEIRAYYSAADPCTHPALADGTVCNDSNACTQTDTCQAGACVGGNPRTCVASDQCHATGACDPASGVCSNPAKPDGKTCNDGQTCTQGEACVAGSCQPAANPYPVVLNLPVQDLGSFGPQSFANDINNAGVAVGWSSPPDFQNHAWRSSGPGTITDLATTLNLGLPSSAQAINDAGTIVGFQTLADGSHAFRYGAAGFEAFDRFGDGSSVLNQGDIIVLHAGDWLRGAFPTDVNEAGDFVGFYTLNGKFRGFRFTSEVEEIPALADGGTTFMYGISDAGTAVGSATLGADSGSPTHAVLFDDAVGLMDLDTFIDDPGDAWTLLSATSIDGDFIVGTGLLNGDPAPRAYRLRRSNNTIVDLSGGWSTTSARKVNAAGDTVGTGYVTLEDAQIALSAGFVYTDALGFKKLDDMITRDVTWGLRDATSINDAGEIVGWAYHQSSWGPAPFRTRLPAGQSASCQARNMCGGGDTDPVCLFSDGVVETSPGHFVAVFGFDNAGSSSIQPTVNVVQLGTTDITSQQPPPAILSPGTHNGAFLPKFDGGQEISWTVNGETVRASTTLSPRLSLVPIGGNGYGVVIAGRTIMLKADTGPYSTPPANEPTTQLEPVHTMPFNGVLTGQLAVSPTGAATYTVPIKVPPGVAGMAPNLSLVYNSQGGLGIAGQGWELSGLSMIHRCPKTKEQDGMGHHVSLLENDFNEGVCLDGKRMFEQINDPLVYKLEQDDHSTITKVSDVPPWVPAPGDLRQIWFKVVTKTGETRYYGKSPLTRVLMGAESQVAIWALERVEDIWGNYLDFHYNDDNPSAFATEGIQVSSIDYTGHVPEQGVEEIRPFEHVRFTYETRREKRSVRLGEATLPKSKRLATITTSAGTYSLTYAPDYRPGTPYTADNDPMLPTRLTSIGYCAAFTPAHPEQLCTKSLDFGWDGGHYRWDPAPAFAPPEPIDAVGENRSTRRGSQFIDLDGDGRLDFVRSYGLNPDQMTSHAWWNTGSGWDPRDTWALPLPLVSHTGATRGVVFADVNGDGLPDLVSTQSEECPPRAPCPGPHLAVWLNRMRTGATGTWEYREEFENLASFSGSSIINFLTTDRIADMNGDGKADLVRFGPGDLDLQVRYSTGAGWSVPAENYDLHSIRHRDAGVIIWKMKLDDVNRDGLPDIVWGLGENNLCPTIAFGLNTGKNHRDDPDLDLEAVWDVQHAPTNCTSTINTPMDKQVVGDLTADGFRDRVSWYRARVNNAPDQGLCSGGLGSQCFCPANCTAGHCSQEQTTCTCQCPDNVTVTEDAKMAIATGRSYQTVGNQPFLTILSNFRPHRGESSIPASAHHDFIFAMADLNADGLADAILNHVQPGFVHRGRGQLLLNNGAGFDDLEGAVGWEAAAPPAQERWVPLVPTEDRDYPSEGGAFIDLDGDGVTDAVQAKIDSNGSLVKNAWLNRYRPPVIRHFPNGLARPSEVRYEGINTAEARNPPTGGADPIYTDTAHEPEAGTTFLTTPMRVVASVAAEDGTAIGRMFTTSYFYDSLRGSAYGRGPQGFKKIRIVDGRQLSAADPNSRKVTETTYMQFFPYTGLPRSVDRYVSIGGLPSRFAPAYLTRTQTDYCDVTGDGLLVCRNTPRKWAPGATFFIYPLTVFDWSYLYDGDANMYRSSHQMARTTSYRYDSSGNLTRTGVSTEVNDGNCTPRPNGVNCPWHFTNTVNTYVSTQAEIPTSDIRRFGKVTRTVVTSQSNITNGPAPEHTTEFDYIRTTHGGLALRKKRVEPGLLPPLEQHTAYGYDRFGNLAETHECAGDFQFCLPGTTPTSPFIRKTEVSYVKSAFTPPPGGRVTALDYGDGRFPVMAKNAVGHVEYSAYDPALGLPVQKTGPNGIHTCLTYDGLGRLRSQVDRCGTTQEMTTSTDRFVREVSDPNLAMVVTRTRAPTGVATWTYGDALARTIITRGRTFGGGFVESSTTYDIWGRVAQQSAPRDRDSTGPTFLTTTTYDEMDRVVTVTRDLAAIDLTGVARRAIQTLSYRGMTIRTEHNVDGEDAAHLRQQPREETKNVLGKVAVVDDLVGGVMSYFYDVDGHLTDTFDGPNSIHMEYDRRGRRQMMRDPDLGEWHYEYTGFGELRKQTDANANAVTMTYDKLGRMTSRRDDQTMKEARWVYDRGAGAGKGKLAAMVSEPDERLQGTCAAPYDLPSGEQRAVRVFTYTPFGELQDVADCTDGDDFVTSRSYDLFGREQFLTYPQVGLSRLRLQYNYTSLGFLHYVSDAADGSLYWAATARDATGQVTSEYTRNGVETTSMRNPATGWLMRSSSTSHADGDTLIQNWHYEFDEVGNLRARLRSDAVNGPPSQEIFGYDALNRLRSSTVNVGSTEQYQETYDIDTLGNLTRKGDKNLTYGSIGSCVAGPHAVCMVNGSLPFQYDANGNLLNGADRTITYNLANKVTHIQSGPNGVGFIYDADGNRVVQEATGASATARTIYVGLGPTGRSLYELTKKGGATEHTHFLYAGAAHGGNAFALKVVHEAPATEPSATMSFYHFDHLGSVTATSDDNGHVVNAATGGGAATVAGYDPWGARRSPEGRPGAPSSFQLMAGHREFTGHETIPGVGLINMNGRVYDPTLGRFLSPDPTVQFVADLQSYNRYSYVLNNPLRYTDPTGYSSKGVGSSIMSFAMGLATAAACAGTSGAACTFFTLLSYYYQVTSMAVSGASLDQIYASIGVGIAAGFLGGVPGDAITGGIEKASLQAQILNGALSDVMSETITAVVLHKDLGGDDVLKSAFTGAANAGVAAWARGANKVTQSTKALETGEDAWGGWGNSDAYQKSKYLMDERRFLESAPGPTMTVADSPLGAGVPPGGRFAAGTCASCIKPPLARDPWDSSPNHPFKEWIFKTVSRFFGNGVDDTLDNFANVLTNRNPPGSVPPDIGDVIGTVIENRKKIGKTLDDVDKATRAAPGAFMDFIKRPREDVYNNYTLDGM